MSVQISTVDPPPHAAPEVDLCLPDIVELLDGLVGSAEPAVVLLSAARLCTPQLCVAAVAAVSEAGERAYRIASPAEPSWPPQVDPTCKPSTVLAFGGVPVPPNSVVTELSGPATTLHSAYDGVLVMTFGRAAPTDRLLGQLVVDRVVSLVAVERLCDIAEMHRTYAENLQAALRSSREIGVALGVIMNRLRLTEARAFDLLRVSSQESQRKLRDLAADIVYTGALDVLGPALPGGGDAS
jgi:hypothetical protein